MSDERYANFLRYLEQLAAPKTNNKISATEIGNGTSSLLGGRKPTTKADIKYASRNISPAELKDIRKTGYAKAPATGSPFTGGQDKWWSAADDKGSFGRNWNKGSFNIRVPIDQIKANRAVPASALEVLEKGKFVPINAGNAALKHTLIRGLNFLGPISVGAEFGALLHQGLVPYRTEDESIILDEKRSGIQRIVDKLSTYDKK